MPPGPASPAIMPTIRNTRSSGAPKRIATKLDIMPARTSRAPSRMPMLIASRAAIGCESPPPLVMRTRRAPTANYSPRVWGAPREPGLKPDPPDPRHDLSVTAAGIACGTGAALFWAAGFVAARHGIAVGFAPADIVFHRFVWAGLGVLPVGGLRWTGGR